MSNPRPMQKSELGWPTGDQPGELRFQYAPTAEARDAILRALSPVFPPAGASSAELYALNPPEGVGGRYRLTTAEGEWFVRVSMWWQYDASRKKGLVDYLAARSIPMNQILVGGIVLEWEGWRFHIDVHPLIEGRHFNGSLDDLAQVASTLAACHTVLRDFRLEAHTLYRVKVRYVDYQSTRWAINKVLLEGNFDIFGDQADWAREHVGWLREMVRDFTPLFHKLPGAQCLHGQVHPGNVIFRASDGIAVLVDWEEAVRNYAPPAFDLAYFVQRFCLRDDPTPDVLRQRLDTITAHYGPLPPLAEMMRQLAWMSITAIVGYQQQGIATPISEYDKFVRLEAQARALIGVL